MDGATVKDAGLVEVFSNPVDTPVSDDDSARHLLMRQLRKVEIRRQLVIKGQARLDQLVVRSYEEEVRNFEGKDMTREACMKRGLTLSKLISFSSDKNLDQIKRDRFVEQFNENLEIGRSSMKVCEIKCEVKDKTTSKMTINFGYVAFFSRDGEAFELAYLVHEARLQLSQRKLVEGKKTVFLGITIKSESDETILAPCDLNMEDLFAVKEGYLKEKAMEKIQSEDRFLVPQITYID